MTKLGPVDVLINNAGISSRGRAFEEIDDEIMAEMFDINIKGAYVATRSVLAGMKERKEGRIINTSSIFGMAGTAQGSHYCGAKAALIGLTKAWAKEFAPWNILVNAVAPGFIKTDMTDVLSDEVHESLLQYITLGRLGKPEEIASVVDFLASDRAAYITGQPISVNGGMHMG